MALLALSALAVSALGQQAGLGGLAPRQPIGQGPAADVPAASSRAYPIYPANPVQAPLSALPRPSGASYSVPQFSVHRPGGPMSADERELENTVETLVQQLGSAKDEDIRDDLRKKLSRALEGQFDLRQKRHEAEIAELEAQVKRLRDLVQKRQENRREIVSKRLDQLLRDAQGLGW
jgi:hypothetical protein